MKLGNKNLLKRLLSTLLATIMLFSPITTHASIYWSHGSPTANFTVKPFYNLYNNTWVTILNNGMNAWNYSPAHVSVAVSSYSLDEIQAASYADSWYGLTWPYVYPSTGILSHFIIQINSRTIFADAGNFNNFAKGIVAHEFGHCFWLDDNPTLVGDESIMNYSRNRNVICSPQPFDIANVNAIY